MLAPPWDRDLDRALTREIVTVRCLLVSVTIRQYRCTTGFGPEPEGRVMWYRARAAPGGADTGSVSATDSANGAGTE